MKYRRLIVPEYGGPDVLRVVEHELRPPGTGEARIRVLAASVSRPVDAIGEGVSEVKRGDRVGALTVTGGYTEVLYWRADRLIPVPATIDPARAVPVILNYIVAFQTMHRKALVKSGDAVNCTGLPGDELV